MALPNHLVQVLAGVAIVFAGCGGAHKHAHGAHDHGGHAQDPDHPGSTDHGEHSEHAEMHAGGEGHGGMHGSQSARSAGTVADSVKRLEVAIEAKGLRRFITIDHAANARAAGLEMRPTTLVIFGNPKVGGKLMAAKQTMGLSLPMKILVYEDSDGLVWVTYETAKHLAHRHGATNVEPVIGKVAKVLAGLAQTAAGSAVPPADSPAEN